MKEMEDLMMNIENQYKNGPKFSSAYLKIKDAETKLVKLEE